MEIDSITITFSLKTVSTHMQKVSHRLSTKLVMMGHIYFEFEFGKDGCKIRDCYINILLKI